MEPTAIESMIDSACLCLRCKKAYSNCKCPPLASFCDRVGCRRKAMWTGCFDNKRMNSCDEHVGELTGKERIEEKP
jgi:hypothetical protein